MPIIGALEPDTMGANFVDRLVRAAVNAGARRPHILAAIGITNAQLRNPVGRLPGTALIDLFAALEREFADPAIALKVAGLARPDCFSDLGFIATFATTVGEMLSTTVDLQSFRQNVWYVALDRNVDPVRLVWRFPNAAETLYVSAVEFSIASYVHLLHNSTPAALTPLAIYFRHKPRFSADLYAQLLGCPVTFGADHTRIDFDPDQLDLPVPTANPALQRELLGRYGTAMEWLSAGKRHASFTYLYLASELNKSTLKLDHVAASLDLNERTLRRRLVEEGLPFRELLEKVRRDMCDLYRMENRRSMSEIAELLGYAELSAFTRAHRQWYGKPPTG